MCYLAKGNYLRDGRTPWDSSHPQYYNHPRDGREVRDGRTKGNRYKNGLDFIITFVVVNLNYTFLLVSLLNKIVTS